MRSSKVLFFISIPTRTSKQCCRYCCYGYNNFVQLGQWMQPLYGSIEWLLDQHHLSITCSRPLGADWTFWVHSTAFPRSRSIGLRLFVTFVQRLMPCYLTLFIIKTQRLHSSDIYKFCKIFNICHEIPLIRMLDFDWINEGIPQSVFLRCCSMFSKKTASKCF